MTSPVRIGIHVVAFVVVVLAYAWVPFVTRGLYGAPDERAAVYAIERVRVTGGEWMRTRYAELGGLEHPRSLVVQGGRLVPGFWLGLPMVLRAATVATGVPASLAVVFVPVLAAAAVWAWGATVARWMRDKRVGAWAAFALAVHPAWWYFSARGLHPNVAFVSWLILGAWVWTVASRWGRARGAWARSAWLFAGGLCFGMALFTRGNEAVWVVPLLFGVAWACRRRPFREHVAAVVGVAIPLVFMGWLNAQIYGSPWQTGYTLVGDALPQAVTTAMTAGAATSTNFLASLGRALFPFGVHEMNVLRHARDYQLLLFAPWSAFAAAGLIWLAARWTTVAVGVRKRLARACPWVALAGAYLLVVYGSWVIRDNPDPTAVTIGVSYVRYWLPILVAMTVPIGVAFAWGVRPNRRRAWQVGLRALWALAFVGFAWMQVMAPTGEGLRAVVQTLRADAELREEILKRTSGQDLIIVDRADKFLFPDRSVVVPLRDEAVYAALPVMVGVAEARGAQVWYFGGTLPEHDEIFLKETRLRPAGLEIRRTWTSDGQSLYLFERL